VAKEIEFEDPRENMGAKMVLEAATRTGDSAGDGTTTAVVLAEAIFSEGLKNVAAGANPIALRRGIEYAVDRVCAFLKDHAVEVRDAADIEHAGTVAAGGNVEVGRMLAEAMAKVGRDGIITVEDGRGMETTIQYLEGMTLDRGWITHHFETTPGKVELRDCLILIWEDRLHVGPDMVPLLQLAQKAGKPLLIIAEDVIQDALATLVANHVRKTIQVCAIKAPASLDRKRAILLDIAAATGGTAILKELALKVKDVKFSMLGQAKKIIVDAKSTLILDGAGSSDALKLRVEQIKSEIASAPSAYEREKMQERMAKLTGAVAQLSVGGATEIEMRERKMRVEDALYATRAAVQEGLLPGGGVALLRAILEICPDKGGGDETLGIEIVRRALEAPLRQIAENAGVNGAVVAAKVKEGGDPRCAPGVKSRPFGFGFNAETLEYEDLMAAGIVDPLIVVRSALQNAASVAVLLLTTEAVVSACRPEENGKA